jgi:hypothetical protein
MSDMIGSLRSRYHFDPNTKVHRYPINVNKKGEFPTESSLVNYRFTIKNFYREQQGLGFLNNSRVLLFAHQIFNGRLDGLSPDFVSLYVGVQKIRHNIFRKRPVIFEEVIVNIQIEDFLSIGNL